MTKKFFTKVSPKAYGGIRRVYEGKGYHVHGKLQSDGSITVVAVRGEASLNGGTQGRVTA